MSTGMASPLQVGDRVTLQAIRLNDDGDGVSRIDGWTVFVPGLLPGEEAQVVITKVDRSFARGQIESRRTEAGDRITPACPVFDACGGCQLQHVGYQTQLAHKRQMVESAMRRIGKFEDVPVLPTIGMAHPWRYRNQVQMPVQYDATSRSLRYGFFAPNSHNLIATEACVLEPLEMEQAIADVARILADALGARAAAVHHIIVRRSHTTGELLIVIAIHDAGLDLHTAAQDLLQLPHVVGVARTIQPRVGGPVWGKTVENIAGASHITETVCGVEYLISPRSFFQVNTVQAERLFERAVACARPTPDDVVLDAYCGTGSLSLILAKTAQQVVGIETIADAVTDARRNAAHNGLDNATFHVGEVERVLPALLRQGQRFDVAVLDPPRKGCHPAVLQALLAARPERIVYVSCNHATLARDLRILADGGYQVGELQPVDMFPQTSHVECVGVLY